MSNSFTNSILKFIVILCFFSLIAITGARQAYAQQSKKEFNSNSMIKLKSGFLSPLKFVYGTNKPQNVYTFGGLSFQPGFQEIMSTHPPALNEAKRAFVYNGISLAGSVALVGISLKMLLDTIEEAENVSEGNLSSSDDDYMSDLIIIGASAGVMVISAILGSKHLKKGILIFNKKQLGNRAKNNSDGARNGISKNRGLGLKFGLNFRNINYKDLRNSNSKTGITFGCCLSF